MPVLPLMPLSCIRESDCEKAEEAEIALSRQRDGGRSTAFPSRETARSAPPGKGVLVRVSRFVASRPLGQLPEPGREQGDVESMDPLQYSGTDNQLGQRIEIAARGAVCP